jgi:predicted ATPase
MQFGMGLWYLLPMLTRLKVDGFKNLVGVDVRFGPFNCIAGANGVGKSNLFDAIRLLSLTARFPLAEAARRVRDGQGGNSDVRGLFHRTGGHWGKKMTFEVEMVVPTEAGDDLGQIARAVWTYLTYKLEIRLREGGQSSNPQHPMEIVTEELGVAKGEIGFSTKSLDGSPAGGIRVGRKYFGDPSRRYSTSPVGPFIITERIGDGANIKLRSGRRTPVNQATATSPHTSLLSQATAIGSPTAYCAQRELESWQLLQLDPGALRLPDEFNSPAKLEANGRRLAATLARLTGPLADSLQETTSGGAHEGKVFGRLANRLSGLVSDVCGIRLDRDEKRSLNTVLFRMRDGTEFPARDMSDGTLRLLALALLELDPEAPRVICLGEPENGVHPDRLPAIVQLLRDIALDPMEELDDETNPVRQVIVNTHSPSVVMAVPEDSLIGARSVPGKEGERVFQRAEFAGIAGTWRARLSPGVPAVSKGELLSYLDPAGLLRGDPAPGQGERRVVDRDDIRKLLGE